jgi:hypothetical protein
MPFMGADLGLAPFLDAVGGMMVAFFIAGPLDDFVLLLIAMVDVLS